MENVNANFHSPDGKSSDIHLKIFKNQVFGLERKWKAIKSVGRKNVWLFWDLFED